MYFHIHISRDLFHLLNVITNYLILDILHIFAPLILLLSLSYFQPNRIFLSLTNSLNLRKT